MKPLDLFMRFQNMRSKKPQGQIAIMFIILIALVFVFMAIVMNIGKITLQKTDLDNAVDSAALLAASDLSSLSNAYDRQTGCTTDWKDIFGLVAGFVLIIVPGLNTLGTILIGSSVGSIGLQDYLANKQWRDMMSNVDEKSQIQEQAVVAAMGLMVQDPNTFTDGSDLNGNGDQAEEISEFIKWHYFRTKGLAEGGGDAVVVAAMKAFNCFITGQCGYGCSCGGGSNNLWSFQNALSTSSIGFAPQQSTSGRDHAIGYNDYFKNEFSKLMTDLWNLYLSDPAKYAIIKQQIDRAPYAYSPPLPTRFWNPGDCSAANPSACDSVEDLIKESGIFNQFILQLQSTIGSSAAWGHANEIMSLLYGKGDPNICGDPKFADLCTGDYDVNWYNRIAKWRNWMDDWKPRIDTILNSGLFKTREECQIECNDRCDVPCQTQAKNYCCPNIGNNCCPPEGTTGPGGTCDTEAYNYCNVSGGQGYNECIDSNMYHFESYCLEGLCNQKIYQMWTGCYDPLNSSQSQMCCLNRVLNSIVWSSSCPIPGYCPGGSYSCQERINPFYFPSCLTECYSGPNGNDGKYQQCVDRVTSTCLGSAVSDCYSGIFSNQCFQDAYNNCYPGQYHNCYWGPHNSANCMPNCLNEGCYPGCYYRCYKPIREDLMIASRVIENFRNAIENLRVAMDSAKTSAALGLSKITAVPAEAIYAWKDSLGWHFTMVKVSGFLLPTRYHYTKWFGVTKCISLANKVGSAQVQAWRYDQEKETKFAGKANVGLWKFQYGRKTTAVPPGDFPVFMNNPNVTKWSDPEVDLLNKDSQAYVQIKDFLEKYGMVSNAVAHYGPEQSDIYLKAAH